jgi:hypothetical protein
MNSYIFWDITHSGGYEELYLLGYNSAVVMKSYIFWNITPCSPLKVKSLCFPPALTLISRSAYSILSMEALCSCEISVEFQLTAWR